MKKLKLFTNDTNTSYTLAWYSLHEEMEIKSFKTKLKALEFIKQNKYHNLVAINSRPADLVSDQRNKTMSKFTKTSTIAAAAIAIDQQHKILQDRGAKILTIDNIADRMRCQDPL